MKLQNSQSIFIHNFNNESDTSKALEVNIPNVSESDFKVLNKTTQEVVEKS